MKYWLSFREIWLCVQKKKLLKINYILLRKIKSKNSDPNDKITSFINFLVYLYRVSLIFYAWKMQHSLMQLPHCKFSSDSVVWLYPGNDDSSASEHWQNVCQTACLAYVYCHFSLTERSRMYIIGIRIFTVMRKCIYLRARITVYLSIPSRVTY